MSDQQQQVHIVPDQVYSTAGGEPRLADVYLPQCATDLLPVVIWLHGGGWRFGDRRLAPDLASFAQQSGLAVVSIDYRLSDEVKFPTPVEDVKTAVRWIRSVASNFGLDSRQIGLWGSSAGAHLAACAALSAEDEFLAEEHSGFSSAVQAVVDGYGPTNFGRIDEARSAMRSIGTDAESLIVGGVLPAGDENSFESRLLGAPVSSSPAQVQFADPVQYVRSGSPPFLILHGEADTLIPWSQSRYLFDALTATGSDATLVLFSRLKHGFFNNKDLELKEYGIVSLYPPENGARSPASWSCNLNDSIPAMVSSFFRTHLALR